jgi:hypothetical protein
MAETSFNAKLAAVADAPADGGSLAAGGAASSSAEEGEPPPPPAKTRKQLAALTDPELKARVLELGVTLTQLLTDDGPGFRVSIREALIELAARAAERAGTERDQRVDKSAAEWRRVRGTSASVGLPESKFHITLQPNTALSFFGEAYEAKRYEAAIQAAELLRSFGCFTIYNPNTDFPGLDDGDERTAEGNSEQSGVVSLQTASRSTMKKERMEMEQEKEQSSRLQEFRDSLERSRKTKGFVWQLQPACHPPILQLNMEQNMSVAVAGCRVPVIGTYAAPTTQDVTNALDIAMRQWEEGVAAVEGAQLSELHEDSIDDAALRRLCDVRRHPVIGGLTALNLFGTQIADATPLQSLRLGLTSLNLGYTQVPDERFSVLGALVELSTLNLYGTYIVDVAPLARLTSLTSLVLGSTPVVDVTPLGALDRLTKLDVRCVCPLS